MLFVSLLSLSLLATAQDAAVDGVRGDAHSPSTSASWACDLRIASGQSVKVDVSYDGSNQQVTVNVPSIDHSFTRSAKFDSQFMMWTEDAEVGRAVLWTIVRSTLEIRLTRIIGSLPRVNSGQCQGPSLAN